MHRGGIAILSAMFSRAFIQDLRQARKNGGYPTVDDLTRAVLAERTGIAPLAGHDPGPSRRRLRQVLHPGRIRVGDAVRVTAASRT